MEAAKFQVIQWLVTIGMSAGALGLGTLPFLCHGGANGSVCSIVQLKSALCLYLRISLGNIMLPPCLPRPV
jgi:hypothetical protein